MWPEWSGVTRSVGLGQPRGEAIYVPRRHAGRLEVAFDPAPPAFHVLEHAEDAFRRAAKLLAKRVALFGLGLTQFALTRGTAFITDIGMTGSHAGCIGMDKDESIARFLSPATPRPQHSKGDVRINAVLIVVDDSTGRAREISRLSLPHES